MVHFVTALYKPLVNAYFETLESLDLAVGDRCLALTQQTETIRDSTLFHWWPRQSYEN